MPDKFKPPFIVLAMGILIFLIVATGCAPLTQVGPTASAPMSVVAADSFVKQGDLVKTPILCTDPNVVFKASQAFVSGQAEVDALADLGPMCRGVTYPPGSQGLLVVRVLAANVDFNGDPFAMVALVIPGVPDSPVLFALVWEHHMAKRVGQPI